MFALYACLYNSHSSNIPENVQGETNCFDSRDMDTLVLEKKIHTDCPFTEICENTHIYIFCTSYHSYYKTMKPQ